MIKTHMFWAYGDFTKLEILCAKSFLKQGFELTVWTYGDLTNAPNQVAIKDARQILSEKEVFLNKRGSYAGFSDLFRYAVLSELGGLYVDTDVLALKNAKYLPNSPFLVTERTGTKKNFKNFIRTKLGFTKDNRINGNVLYNPSPIKGDLIDLAYHYSLRFPKDKVHWSEIGPNLLTAITRIYPEHGYKIFGPEFANDINSNDCPHMLLKPKVNLKSSSFFLHCYNEKWNRQGFDKNMDYPVDSILYKLEKDINADF